MKLAYFSPLNPQPSGISDYSEDLLAYLATEADITLFVDGFEPSNPQIRAQFTHCDYRRHPSVLQTLNDYDAAIYHIGNDHRYHAGILEAAREHPGIIVFHDFALQDFFLGLAQARGNVEVYLEEVAACHGYDAAREAAEALERCTTPPLLARPTDFPLNCRLARGAEGIIAHSEWARARFLAAAPNVPVTHINMPIRLPPVSSEAKPGPEERGAASDVVQIANFGLITPGKGIEKALRALSSLKADHNFHYTLVGETSASLCRIMAAGVPAIIFNVGAFSELPNDVVVKIDHDEYADALLEAYLRRLIEDASLREQIGRNARQYILARHDIEQGAASYLAFIREVIALRPRRQFLRNVADEMSLLGVRANDDSLLRGVAREVAMLVPGVEFTNKVVANPGNAANLNPPSETPAASIAAGNGHDASAKPRANSDTNSVGRLPKIEGIDYKRAALDYPRMLDAERSYYLRTKPFYNLANKPEKHLGDGMDAETHRHFTDFANMATVLALPPGARILDVGCGSGWLSEYFARLGYQVTGIDLSNDLIGMARDRVERVPYDVDHETPLRCRFLSQDIEIEPLPEKFDAVICYDSLHHFEDERTVLKHLTAMLDVGGLLFILEGHKPSAGSATEDELQDVMRRYGTLESPFSYDYLCALLDEHGLAVVGDYVSVNGLFERQMLEGDRLPLRTLATDYHYLTCIKVADGAPATSVPDSRSPRVLRAEFNLCGNPPRHVEAGAKLNLVITIRNAGDTLWLSGQTLRAGVVMPGVRVIDERGEIVSEVHGHPKLPRSVAPGQTIAMSIPCLAPLAPGTYTFKIDLVDQHVCWFEERGSEPLLLGFKVIDKANGPRQRTSGGKPAFPT